MVQEVESVEQFEAILTDSGSEKHFKKYVLVDFYAVWCGPCMRFAPTLEELSETYGKDVYFLKVNVDNLEELSERYKISALPTFMFFDVGSLESGYEVITGASKSQIEERLKYLSGKNLAEGNPEAFDF